MDSLFVRKLGRRKSWLVPVQFIIGVYMIYFSNHVQDILEKEKSNNHGSGILSLTLIFIFLSFLTATQDIAVDGWVNKLSFYNS